MKKDFIEYDGKTEDEADRIIQQKLIININGKEPITPIEYICPKIFYE